MKVTLFTDKCHNSDLASLILINEVKTDRQETFCAESKTAISEYNFENNFRIFQSYESYQYR